MTSRPSTTVAPRPFRATRSVRLLFAFMAVGRLQPHLAVWVVYLTDYRDLSLAQVGLMETFFQVVKMVGQVPTGAFADRYGRRLTFIVGMAIEGAGILLFGLASNFPLLVLSYALWAFGLTFWQGNENAYIYDALGAEDREREYPSHAGRLLAITATAGMFGSIVGSAVASQTNLMWGIVAGAVPVIPSMLVALAMREPPRKGGVRPSYVATLRGAFAALRARAAVRWAILFEVAIASSRPANAILFQPFLARHDVPVAWFGAAIVPVALGAVVGSIGSARVVQTFGIQRTFALSLVGSIASLVVLATVDSIWALTAYPLFMASLSLGGPALSGYVNTRTESALRATVLSVAPLGIAVVFSMTAAGAGIIGDAHLLEAYAALAATLAILGGGAYAMWLRADRGERGGGCALEAK